MKIITNSHPRPLLDWSNLTEKEQQEFDWLETEDEQCSVKFFRYRGQIWCLDEFVRTSRDGELADWDGVYTSHAFLGVLIKLIYGTNKIVVGRCYS